MNLTGHSERNRKQDVYFRNFRSSLPGMVFNNSLHSYGTSEHLINTKTSFRKEQSFPRPTVPENAVRRPSLLRLDSQGESSKNDWDFGPSHADETSSRNVPTLALFSDVLRRFADTPENRLTDVRYHKPKPIKPYGNSLNITSDVKRLCQKNDILFPCHQHKASRASCGDVMSSMQQHPLHYWSKVIPSCTNEGIFMQHTEQKPVELVSELQLQPEEHQNNCGQALQCDYHIALLSVRSLVPVPLPCVVDLTDCVSTFKQDRHENSVNRLSVVSFRSSDTVDSDCTLHSRWVRRQSRQPRYNCRRRWLHVCHNTRYRKPSARAGTTFCADTDSSSDDCELHHSDIDSNKYTDSVNENKLILSDGDDAVPQYFSSLRDLIPLCEEKNDTVWLNHCCSQLSLPSSLYDIQETHTSIQESCSFASLFFISGKEVDSSDVCSTDSDEVDGSGFMSPSSTCRTDDVLADALLSGLPYIPVPHTDNWMMGFSDCTPIPSGFDCDFELYFEEDTTSVPGPDVACKYSKGVREANARWNEAYSFTETYQHYDRMV